MRLGRGCPRRCLRGRLWIAFRVCLDVLRTVFDVHEDFANGHGQAAMVQAFELRHAHDSGF